MLLGLQEMLEICYSIVRQNSSKLVVCGGTLGHERPDWGTIAWLYSHYTHGLALEMCILQVGRDWVEVMQVKIVCKCWRSAFPGHFSIQAVHLSYHMQ